MTFTVLIATILAALAMGIAPGAPTPAYLAINLVYSAAASAIGGYATASLAQARHSAHAMILALMILVVNVSGFFNPQPGQERWYLAALIVLGPVSAVVGGRIRVAAVARRAAQVHG